MHGDGARLEAILVVCSSLFVFSAYSGIKDSNAGPSLPLLVHACNFSPAFFPFPPSRPRHLFCESDPIFRERKTDPKCYRVTPSNEGDAVSWKTMTFYIRLFLDSWPSAYERPGLPPRHKMRDRRGRVDSNALPSPAAAGWHLEPTET